jgi:1-acyl-sn-glycerol-3-phosphate acyltransferase
MADLITGTITRLAGGCEIYGRENVPDTGCIVAANHVSFFDPPIMSYALPRYTYFIAKRELFEMPILGWWIHIALAFPVEQHSPDRIAIRNAAKLLKAGECITMFPEAGRSPDGTLQPAELGAAFIARVAGVPIVPCALTGTDDQLPLEAKFVRRGRVRVKFDEPIDAPAIFEEHPGKEGLQMATDAVMDSIRVMQLELYEMAGKAPPEPATERHDTDNPPPADQPREAV